MSEENAEEDETELVQFLSDAGFTIVPMQTIIDALAKMEEYLREQAGISQEELEELLKKIEDLVGKEAAMDLELDEILSWIKAFRDS